ncbi:hypothetical protein KKH23_11005 [Patescibacteria group bacterium]|nr:hypothetical protein [Patescibacteria group bacterium]MBU1067620.1 hypothetical protein [Patescibacteria group bacterium]
MSAPEVVVFVLLGLLGGFTYILVEVAKKWEDLLTFSAFRRYALGAIVGYLYHIGYSTWTLPNSLMCWVSGYMGTHFIEALVRRYESLK